jgi:hypothetical protein
MWDSEKFSLSGIRPEIGSKLEQTGGAIFCVVIGRERCLIVEVKSSHLIRLGTAALEAVCGPRAQVA